MKLLKVVKSRIKVLGRSKGLFFKDIAKKIGMNDKEFSQRLNGRIEIRLKDLDAISKVLGVDAYELLKDEFGESGDFTQ